MFLSILYFVKTLRLSLILLDLEDLYYIFSLKYQGYIDLKSNKIISFSKA
jgi:hypothetical protein